MSKILISGSWRYLDKKLETLVRKTVREILERGDEIITGGALGVDFWALDEALKIDLSASRIQVFLPSTLSFYRKHYKKRAAEGIISTRQYKDLIAQLKELRNINKAALIETPGIKILNQVTYYARNSLEVYHADELIAFQVNQSKGTEDVIEKAKKKGISVQVHHFAL